jgi:hypothetical protein
MNLPIEDQLQVLEARPPRYDIDTEAERMADLRAAHGICELDGTAIWTPSVERLFRLLASGRITTKQYMRLARASNPMRES